MPNVFDFSDDILISGFIDQGKGHNAQLLKVLRVCRHTDLKCNKDKYLFRYANIPFFGEIMSLQGISPDPRKVQVLSDMLPWKNKKELQSLLGIQNYQRKVSPVTAELCEPL